MNRTKQAVSGQLQALGGPGFEIRALRPDGTMVPRDWPVHIVLKSLDWLRMLNRNGCDIYVRAVGRPGLVLLDDLAPAALSALRHDGFPPTVTIQTSPGNFQAWIRLVANSQCRSIPNKLLTAAAVELATRYRADLRSADWYHLGRLAGFTNRKPHHQRHGLYPFVLLHKAREVIAPCGRRLLQKLLSSMNASSSRDEPQSETIRAPEGTYAQRYETILRANRQRLWASNPDASRMDFMIARDMAREGHHPQQILNLLADSPCIATRKARHIQDYLQRTVTTAFKRL